MMCCQRPVSAHPLPATPLSRPADATRTPGFARDTPITR
jgi:hypothetical protein